MLGVQDGEVGEVAFQGCEEGGVDWGRGGYREGWRRVEVFDCGAAVFGGPGVGRESGGGGSGVGAVGCGLGRVVCCHGGLGGWSGCRC